MTVANKGENKEFNCKTLLQRKPRTLSSVEAAAEKNPAGFYSRELVCVKHHPHTPTQEHTQS